MPSIPFHETRMGHQFFTKTAPKGVRALERIADALEQQSALMQQLLAAQQAQPEAAEEETS